VFWQNVPNVQIVKLILLFFVFYFCIFISRHTDTDIETDLGLCVYEKWTLRPGSVRTTNKNDLTNLHGPLVRRASWLAYFR